MDRRKIISEKLNSVTNREWNEIVDKLTVYVRFKLKGRVKFGAHSENNLGLNAIDFYIEDAIQKLFEHKWDWKFEEYSLLDQLKRIVGSSISENVRKERSKQDNNYESVKVIPTDPDVLSFLGDPIEGSNQETDQTIEKFEEVLYDCSKDDPDLELLVMALHETNDSNEIIRQFGWDKQKLYSLQRKLYRRVRSMSEFRKLKFW